ncbi:MAG: hypothetical protein M0036_25890 [Desulfobacteraceae bacterium]|nr:hypothetical protein [Desulfobacteraceae bacterium]
MSAKAAGKGVFVPQQEDESLSFKKLEPALMVISAAIGEFIRLGDGQGLAAMLVHLRTIERLAFQQLEAGGLDTNTLKKNIENAVDRHFKIQ